MIQEDKYTREAISKALQALAQMDLDPVVKGLLKDAMISKEDYESQIELAYKKFDCSTYEQKKLIRTLFEEFYLAYIPWRKIIKKKSGELQETSNLCTSKNKDELPVHPRVHHQLCQELLQDKKSSVNLMERLSQFQKLFLKYIQHMAKGYCFDTPTTNQVHVSIDARYFSLLLKPINDIADETRSFCFSNFQHFFCKKISSTTYELKIKINNQDDSLILWMDDEEEFKKWSVGIFSLFLTFQERNQSKRKKSSMQKDSLNNLFNQIIRLRLMELSSTPSSSSSSNFITDLQHLLQPLEKYKAIVNVPLSISFQ